MLQATLQLACRVERAEIDFCAILARVGHPDGAGSIEIGGGRAVCGAPGLPMNKVLGLGLGHSVTDEDIDVIEDLYSGWQSPVQIELCPLAVPGVSALLSRRGYVLQGFENELARPAPLRTDDAVNLRIVSPANEDEEETWLRVVSEGFIAAESPPVVPLPKDVFEATANVMRGFIHPHIRRYLAYVDGEPAGAASSFVADRVLGVFGTATLQQFRRRGVQTAIVTRALNDAATEADLAVATTEPGSTSQRTFERLGFQVLYTRAILIKT